MQSAPPPLSPPCTAHAPTVAHQPPLSPLLPLIPCAKRIEAVMKDKEQITKVKFKNADNKYSTERVTFAHVCAEFKPLS